jgi:hypothetical protein
MQQQNRHLQDFTAAMQTKMKESFGFMTQRMVEAEDTALKRQTELEARMYDRMKTPSGTLTLVPPAAQPSAQKEPPAPAQNVTADPAALEAPLEQPPPTVFGCIIQANPQSSIDGVAAKLEDEPYDVVYPNFAIMNKVRPHDLRRLREVSGLTVAECVTTTVQLYSTGELGLYGIEELARDLELGFVTFDLADLGEQTIPRCKYQGCTAFPYLRYSRNDCTGTYFPTLLAC